MERRYTRGQAAGVTIEQRGENQPPLIVGYASVFYDGTPETEYVLFEGGGERWVERIMKGAFDRAAKEDDVRALYNHNPDYLLGRTSAKTAGLSVDGKGLRYWAVQPDTQTGRDVVESIRRGDLTGSSFAFVATEQRWTELKQTDGTELFIREILAVELFDVGPVTYPAYEASTTGIRAAAEPAEARVSLDEWKRHRANSEADLLRVRARAIECN